MNHNRSPVGTQQDRRLRRAAAQNLGRGFVLTPLKQLGKSPLREGWNTDPELRATDVGEEFAWDDRGMWAGCNVGILTAPSGLAVVDIDVSKIDGMQEFRNLCDDLELDFDQIADTYSVCTPSGGLHLYYKAPIGEPLAGKDLCPGVNTRIRGQMVVAAGSRTAQGEYTIHNAGKVRPLPIEFVPLLSDNAHDTSERRVFTQEQADRHMKLYGLDPLLASSDGDRNNLLNIAGVVFGHFVPEFIGKDEAEDQLREAAEEIGLHIDPKCGPKGIAATIASGMKKGQADWVAERPDQDASAPNLDWRLVSGADFILNTPEQTPAIWGTGDQVLWAEGEPLIITGPTGVGKTTVGAQLVLGRIGQLDDLLGFGVAPGHKVLYLACDRPKQIARALRRVFKDVDPDVLDKRLVFQAGPPPRDLARHPEMLLELAQRVGADTVIIDSIKDVAVKLSDEETGQGLNRAFQLCVANGIEVAAYHHQRKRGGSSADAKPRSIDDMYGSTWISAGSGSVVLIWGQAGDSHVELVHLKQPADKVGPLNLVHDHPAGTTKIAKDQPGLVEFLQDRPDGATVREAAVFVTGDDQPGSGAIESSRRTLDGFVKKGYAIKKTGPNGASIYIYEFPG